MKNKIHSEKFLLGQHGRIHMLILQSPVLFSLIYYEDHKLQLLCESSYICGDEDHAINVFSSVILQYYV